MDLWRLAGSSRTWVTWHRFARCGVSGHFPEPHVRGHAADPQDGTLDFKWKGIGSLVDVVFFLSLGSWWFSPIHWDTTNLKSTLKTIIRMGGKTLVSFWSNIAGVHGCYSANSIQFPWVLVCQQVLIHPQIWFRCPWFGFVYVYLNIGLPHSTGWSLYPLFSCHVGRGAPYFRHAQIPCCLRCVCMSIYIYIYICTYIYIYLYIWVPSNPSLPGQILSCWWNTRSTQFHHPWWAPRLLMVNSPGLPRSPRTCGRDAHAALFCHDLAAGLYGVGWQFRCIFWGIQTSWWG